MSDTITQAARDIRTLANALQLVGEKLGYWDARREEADELLTDQITEAVRIAETLEAAAPAAAYLITNEGVVPCTILGLIRNPPPSNRRSEADILVQPLPLLPIRVHPFLVRENPDEALQLWQRATWDTGDDTVEQIVIALVAAQLRETGD